MDIYGTGMDIYGTGMEPYGTDSHELRTRARDKVPEGDAGAVAQREAEARAARLKEARGSDIVPLVLLLGVASIALALLPMMLIGTNLGSKQLIVLGAVPIVSAVMYFIFRPVAARRLWSRVREFGALSMRMLRGGRRRKAARSVVIEQPVAAPQVTETSGANAPETWGQYVARTDVSSSEARHAYPPAARPWPTAPTDRR